MIIGAKIQIRGYLAMPKRKLQEYEMQAFSEALLLWHKKMLPDHFRPNAKQVYHYERRTPEYQRRKLRVKGHQRDLVWSGASERLAERKIVIRRTRKHTDGKISLAKGFNFSGRMGMPDMKAEVKKILKREKTVLFKQIGEHVRSKLNGDASVKVIAI